MIKSKCYIILKKWVIYVLEEKMKNFFPLLNTFYPKNLFAISEKIFILSNSAKRKNTKFNYFEYKGKIFFCKKWGGVEKNVT